MSTISEIKPKVRPSYVCESCWNGVVAHQFGLLLPPVELSMESIANSEPITGGFVYEVPETVIRTGDKQGCRWCHLLVHFASSISNSESDPPSESVVEVRVTCGSSARDDLSIYVNGELCWFGHAYTTKDDPAAAFLSGRNLFCEVGSDQALSLVTELFDDCQSNHRDCPKVSEPYPHLPTRVIDCSDPSRPHLFVTNDTRGRYIALSYVWGESQPHNTTTQNIDSYTKLIDPAILPPTIIDAIQVTHKLGIRYLWIDSLCIIQDSGQDKDHEISRMRNVYLDSYFTIIAASASRVGEGFLQERTDTLGKASVVLPFVIPDSEAVGSVYLSSWLMTTPKYRPSSEPLHTRGWCMQEYFLSPRELIFATHTLQFRCRNGTRNIGGATNPWWIASEEDPSPLQDLPKIPKTREEVEKVREAWKATIKNYTNRSLSLSNDKLLALASLAEEFSEVIDSPYVAGLWKHTLLPDLLWSKEYDRYFTPRPKEYRAPSWSWAAVDGEVDTGNAYFLSDDEKLIAELSRCETILKNPKLPFGEILGGTLVIRARVIFDCVMMAHWAVYRLRGLDEVAMKLEVTASGEMSDSETGRRMQEIGRGQLDSSDDDVSSRVKRISVVPIYSRWDLTMPGSPRRDRVIQGLIVEPVQSISGPSEPEKQMKYRRIGFFQSTQEVGDDDWLERVKEVEIEIV